MLKSIFLLSSASCMTGTYIGISPKEKIQTIRILKSESQPKKSEKNFHALKRKVRSCSCISHSSWKLKHDKSLNSLLKLHNFDRSYKTYTSLFGCFTLVKYMIWYDRHPESHYNIITDTSNTLVHLVTSLSQWLRKKPSWSLSTSKAKKITSQNIMQF